MMHVHDNIPWWKFQLNIFEYICKTFSKITDSMKINTKFLFLVLAFLQISCSPKSWQIARATSSKIAIDSTTEVNADKTYSEFLQPIKQSIDAKMNIIIGTAPETMRGYAPESLLSNFCTDLFRQVGMDFLGAKVDISIVNMGSLRTSIPAGDISIGKVFELMPFENELVIIWLRGDKLQELIQSFARVGGQGVSGMRMEIHNGKAFHLTVNGLALDPLKLYTIATNDYLADGNDRMQELTHSERRINTGLKIRDILLNYIKSETEKGNKIGSKLDGRITIVS